MLTGINTSRSYMWSCIASRSMDSQSTHSGGNDVFKKLISLFLCDLRCSCSPYSHKPDHWMVSCSTRPVDWLSRRTQEDGIRPYRSLDCVNVKLASWVSFSILSKRMLLPSFSLVCRGLLLAFLGKCLHTSVLKYYSRNMWCCYEWYHHCQVLWMQWFLQVPQWSCQTGYNFILPKHWKTLPFISAVFSVVPSSARSYGRIHFCNCCRLQGLFLVHVLWLILLCRRVLLLGRNCGHCLIQMMEELSTIASHEEI